MRQDKDAEIAALKIRLEEARRSGITSESVIAEMQAIFAKAKREGAP